MSFFAGNSYLQILIKLAAFAASNPELFRKLWASLVAAYDASLEFAAKVSEAVGGSSEVAPGTLEMVAATEEEMNAEESLAAVIYPEGTQALREAGQFRKIIGWLVTSEVGRKLLGEVLSKLGS